MIVDEQGTKRWYLNDNLHRIDGPAVEYPSGYKKWYLNGERHREDGPAITCSDEYKAWFLNDKRLTEEEWLDSMTVKLLDMI